MNLHPALLAPCDLALVACSAAKARAPRRPADLYQGRLYQLARRWAEAQAAGWRILSAKHGVLAPFDDPVEPYELALTRLRALERRRWSRRVAAALQAPGRPVVAGRRLICASALTCGDRVVALASRPYVEHLREPLRRAGVELIEPLAGLPIGRQKQALSLALAQLRTPSNQLTLWGGEVAA